MKGIILLMNDRVGTSKPIRDRFNSIDIKGSSLSKIEYVENCIIDAMNNYNSKLNVKEIEYSSFSQIQSQFPSFKEGANHGLLVGEIEINSLELEKYSHSGWYVFSDEGVMKARRILMYLYLSNINEGSRNSFTSQTLFPEMIDYIEEYIGSPSYSMTNYKNCFINLLTKKVTAPSILRHLSSFCLIGMDYIEVFNNYSLNPTSIPSDLKSFLEKYTHKSNYNEFYDDKNDIFDNGRYRIDYKRKQFSLETKTLTIGQDLIRKNNGEYDFHGSSEKFYWIEVLPMSLFAYNQGYSVDFSKYQSFIDEYCNKFSNDSEKMKRCKIILSYIEKYCH